MTKAAAAIWKYGLKNNHLHNYTFRRERPILNYIVDFVCLELLLIIEIDGITHHYREQILSDQMRDKRLTAVGFTILRFSNYEVLHQMNEVLEVITHWMLKNEKSGF